MYNDHEYVRVGDNNMMGKMGRMTEQFYDYDQSVILAQKNGYQITSTQALIYEKTWQQEHSTGNRSISITTGNRIEINESFTIVPSNYERKNLQSETLETGEGLNTLRTGLLIATGGKGSERTVRESYTYQAPLKMSFFGAIFSNVLNVGTVIMMGQHDYMNTQTFNGWDSYDQATSGNGFLLKFK